MTLFISFSRKNSSVFSIPEAQRSLQSVLIATSRIRCNIVVSTWSPTSNLKNLLYTVRASSTEKRRSGEAVHVFPFLKSAASAHISSYLASLHFERSLLPVVLPPLCFSVASFIMAEEKFFNLIFTVFSFGSKYSPITNQPKIEILTMLLLSIYYLHAYRAKLRKELATAFLKVHYKFERFQRHVACGLHLKQRHYALNSKTFHSRLRERKKRSSQHFLVRIQGSKCFSYFKESFVVLHFFSQY